MPEFIEVREVGLRDGIQNIKTVVPTDLKLAWIKAEVAAGVRDIEVCSFVPPKLLPQFADAEEVTKRALQVPGLTVAALMPNLKGAERGAALGVHRLDYVVSVSEGHNLNNVRRSTAESLADLQRIADFLKTIPADKRPRLLCGLATSFGCTIEGNVPHDRVVNFAETVAAMGVGLAQGALDEALKYAKERKAFGQPIAKFQAIQAKLADMSTEIEAARLLTYKSAILKDRGENFTLAAAQAKLKTGRLAVRATEEAVQIHGGYGYIEEYPVCRFYRDAKILTIGEGTDEVQQMVIARALGA